MSALIKNKTWLGVAEEEYIKLRSVNIERLSISSLHGVKKVKFMGMDCLVPDKESNNKVIQDLILQSERELKVRRRLSEEGIPYQAVLPTNVFQDLVANLPLYTFKTIDEEGRINAFGGYYSRFFKHTGTLVVGVVSLLIAFAIITSTAEVGANGKIFVYLSKNFTQVFLFVGLGLAALLADVTGFSQRFVSQKTLKRRLWPKKRDDLGLGWEPLVVRIALPAPPVEIQRSLGILKEKKYNAYLMVHEKAFKVSLLTNKELRVLEDNDPIIATDVLEDGESFTVLHAQWGDFPEEKELIAQIRRQFNVLQDDFTSSVN